LVIRRIISHSFFATARGSNSFQFEAAFESVEMKPGACPQSISSNQSPNEAPVICSPYNSGRFMGTPNTREQRVVIAHNAQHKTNHLKSTATRAELPAANRFRDFSDECALRRSIMLTAETDGSRTFSDRSALAVAPSCRDGLTRTIIL